VDQLGRKTDLVISQWASFIFSSLNAEFLSAAHKNTNWNDSKMLTTTTKENLTSAVDKVITAKVPGTPVCVVGKDGKELFSYATGKRGLESPEQMTTENIFWIASCIKMITGIACMQLVEQGKMILDDVGFVENICPELKNVKVLKDDGTLEDKKRGITLRMLLTHTGMLMAILI
jgi:CubicO group peptidase (beta-lactamase class C family)